MRVSNENVTKFLYVRLKRVQTKGIIPFDRLAICLEPMVAMAADFCLFFPLLFVRCVFRLVWFRRSWLISVDFGFSAHRRARRTTRTCEWMDGNSMVNCEYNYMRLMKKKKRYARTHRSCIIIIINDNRWTGGAKENELAVYIPLMNAWNEIDQRRAARRPQLLVRVAMSELNISSPKEVECWRTGEKENEKFGRKFVEGKIEHKKRSFMKERRRPTEKQ